MSKNKKEENEKTKNPVLPSLESLLRNMKFVKINYDKIKELAPKMAKEKLEIPRWNFSQFINGNTKKTIDFFFLGNTINFAYRDFDTHDKFSTYYKDQLYEGASAMFACLKRALERGINLLEGKELTKIRKKLMRAIFTGFPEIPMLDERLEIFHEVGRVLNKKYRGHFYNLSKKANYVSFDGGKGIVDRLVCDFPSFNDVSIFKGHELKFYKRAQLAVAMTYARLRDTNLFPVSDIDELTVFADYCLPAGLHKAGVLDFNHTLKQKIGENVLIKPDSREEIEIRAATIKASKELTDEVNKYRNEHDKINALNIDAYLWSNSRNLKHHLCRTVDY